MINLVNRVVDRSLAATDATRDRVGARGAKLLNGFFKSPVAGRPTLPFRFAAQCTRALPWRQEPMFLPRKGPPAGGWFAPEELAIQVAD